MPQYNLDSTPATFNDTSLQNVTFPLPTLPTGFSFEQGYWTINGAVSPGSGEAQHTITVGGHSATTGGASNTYIGDYVFLTPSQLAYINANLGSTITASIAATFFFGGTSDSVSKFELILSYNSPSFSPSPTGNGGDPGGNGNSGLHSNPYTLTGTAITDVSTDALALQSRVHRRAKEQANTCELWFYRTTSSSWVTYPAVQPVMDISNAPQITVKYLQPSTLKITLPDNEGLLSRKNKLSSYNYSGGGYISNGYDITDPTFMGYMGVVFDPLLDVNRKILLRVGHYCWNNAASGISPTLSTDSTGITSGSLSMLTDGTLQNFAAGTTNAVVITVGAGTYADLVVDLGSLQRIYHTAIRFGSIGGTTLLPYQVTTSISSNGTNYTSVGTRPIGGDGTVTQVPGDWDDNRQGIAVLSTICDINLQARYIKFHISLPTTQTIAIDELAVYTGNGRSLLGANRFVGYLGDVGSADAFGAPSFTAVDTCKRLADNTVNKHTPLYEQNGTTGTPVELADIAYNLLVNQAMWPSTTPYSSPCAGFPTDIDFNTGVNYTSFAYPVWQGAQNSIYGYETRLFRTIGWWFFSDFNGKFNALEPAYAQTAPDRVFTAGGTDGDSDVRNVSRASNTKNLRNTVNVYGGNANDPGQGVSYLFHPTSVLKYGVLETDIEDPAAITSVLRDKIAQKFIRDYAFNIDLLTCQVAPDFDFFARQIHGFRCKNARLSLYPKAANLDWDIRDQELWYLDGYTETISTGDWYADCEYGPYFPISTQPPNFTSIDPGTASGGFASVVLHWDAITDINVYLINIYQSNDGTTPPGNELNGYSLVAAVPNTAIGQTFTLSTSNNYWFYLTTIDYFGNESYPSQILSVLPGSSAFGPTDYEITDLSVGYVLTQGPDNLGYYYYSFYAQWTSPPGGFTSSRWHISIDTLPSQAVINTESGWPLSESAWNWWDAHRIPAGKEWDRTTNGKLDAQLRLKWPGSLSGHKIYFVFFNSTATRSWHPVRTNIVAVNVP